MRLRCAANVFIGVCVFATWAFAQHEQCPRPAASDVQGAVGPSSCLKVVDGATHPDQIPEAVAFRMFYRAIAQPANATPEQVDMQRAFVSGAMLSEDDLLQLSYVMADYRYALDNLRREFRIAKQSAATIDPATVQRLTAERDRIVDEATANLNARLTKPGMARLHALILSERKKMAIYTSPEVAGNGKGGIK